MRTKKHTRNKRYTKAFFNQPPPYAHNNSHGSTRAACQRRPNAETDFAKVSAAAKVLQAAIKAEHSKLAEGSGGQNMMDKPEKLNTFELVEVDQCLVEYDEVIDELAADEVKKILSLHEKMNDLWNGRNSTNTSATRHEIFDLQQQLLTATVNSHLHVVRFLNGEKKFRSTIEALEEIPRKHEARPGEESRPFVPVSLKQYFDDPVHFSVHKTRGKQELRSAVRLCMEDAATINMRFCELAIENVQAINRSISDDDQSLAMAYAAATKRAPATEFDPFPAGIPEHIRQALCDFEFLDDEIACLRDEVLKIRAHLRCTIMTWVRAGREAWKYGKTHIHDFPTMRRYEYLRVSLAALYIVFLREEKKILRYCAGPGGLESLEMTPKVAKVLSVGKMTPAEVEKDWDERIQEMKAVLMPVDHMIEQQEKVDRDLELKTKNNEDDLWKVFMRPGG